MRGGSLAWMPLVMVASLIACSDSDTGFATVPPLPVATAGSAAMAVAGAGSTTSGSPTAGLGSPDGTGAGATAGSGVGGTNSVRGGSPAMAGTSGSAATSGSGGTGGAPATPGSGGGTGAGGAGSSAGGSSGSAGGSATFTDIFTNILSTKCAACHGSGGLNMSSKDLAHSTLVGADIAGSECMGMKRVVAGDPDMSVLVLALKAEGCRGRTGRMPPSGNPLSAEEIDKVSAWIRAGAMND
jgi:mono/diheme cytochrome c family protein